MKKLLSIVALIAMITVASVANAQGVTTVAASITDATTFEADCNNDGQYDEAGNKAFQTLALDTTLALDLVDSGEMYCQIFADSNAVAGFDIAIAGTFNIAVPNTGLSTGSIEWALLDDATVATIAAGSEAWGYRLTNTTSGDYTGVAGVGNDFDLVAGPLLGFDYAVNNDDNITLSKFDVDDHTLIAAGDVIISELGQVPDGAFFGTELTMATDVESEAGSYTEDITYTQSFN